MKKNGQLIIFIGWLTKSNFLLVMREPPTVLLNETYTWSCINWSSSFINNICICVLQGACFQVACIGVSIYSGQSHTSFSPDDVEQLISFLHISPVTIKKTTMMLMWPWERDLSPKILNSLQSYKVVRCRSLTRKTRQNLTSQAL